MEQFFSSDSGIWEILLNDFNRRHYSPTWVFASS